METMLHGITFEANQTGGGLITFRKDLFDTKLVWDAYCFWYDQEHSKGIELTSEFVYDVVNDKLDIGNWRVEIVDGVTINATIVGNADPEEENMTETTTENTEQIHSASMTATVAEIIVPQEGETTTTTVEQPAETKQGHPGMYVIFSAEKFNEDKNAAFFNEQTGWTSFENADWYPNTLVEFSIEVSKAIGDNAKYQLVDDMNDLLDDLAAKAANALAEKTINPSIGRISTFSDLPAAMTAHSLAKVTTDVATPKLPQQSKKQKQKQAHPANPEALSRLLTEGVGSKAVHKHKPIMPPRPTMAIPKSATAYLTQMAHSQRKEAEDGVDFINTSFAGKTKLGQALDINAEFHFEMPELEDGTSLGKFASVGAFWYYISDERKNEAYRGMFGKNCRNLRDNDKERDIPGFKQLIAVATWVKINTYERLVKDIVDNELPYTNWYIASNTGLPHHPKLATWYNPVLEEIARTLKKIDKTGDKTIEPDFSFLDRQQSNRNFNNWNNRDNRR